MSNLFKKRQEEIELRKKKEAEEAEQLLRDFEADFASAAPEEKRKTAPDTDDGKPNAPLGFSMNAGTRPPREAVTAAPLSSTLIKALFSNEDEEEVRAKAPAVAPTKIEGRKKPRNIDLFLEELKREQTERAEFIHSTRSANAQTTKSPAAEAESIMHAPSTNLFIGNMSLNVTEQDMLEEFGQYGPIASVKILYPKGDVHSHYSKEIMNGFVGFMEADDAEKALKHSRGKMLWDNPKPLIVDWSKPIPIPSQPLYVKRPEKGNDNVAREEVTGSRATRAPFTDEGSMDTCSESSTDSEVEINMDDTMERNDGAYRKISSTALSDKDRQRFEDYLKTLTNSKEHIGKVMMFCIERSESAQEIVQILAESLVIFSTPFPLKLSRLYLVSDILYNSNSSIDPDTHHQHHLVWKYRSAVEGQLRAIFEHWKAWMLAAITSKLMLEQVRRSLLNVLRVWESWSVFNASLLQELRALVGEGSGQVPANVGGVLALSAEESMSMPGCLGRDIDEESLLGADLDGEPLLDVDLDGEPLSDVDVDGEPITR